MVWNMQDVENVVLGRNQEFEDVQRMAETITQSSGDLRATSCASQLHSRFCNLISAVKVRFYYCEFCCTEVYHQCAYNDMCPLHAS